MQSLYVFLGSNGRCRNGNERRADILLFARPYNIITCKEVEYMAEIPLSMYMVVMLILFVAAGLAYEQYVRPWLIAYKAKRHNRV